jgi:predicted metal-dependent hydrolase
MSDIQFKAQDQLSFIYGDEAITYTLIREATAKTDKVQIKVQPNAEVIVKANDEANAEQIHQAVKKRARWIWQSLHAFKAQQALKTTKHYRSGDMMFYLGRRYVLKVLQSDVAKPSVKLVRGQLQVEVPTHQTHNDNEIETLTSQWYRHQAHRVFKQRLEQLLPQANWVTNLPPIRILAMTKQWGSCSIQGTIILNPHLIKASKECIDYVILHELCHIAEHNHSERFWRLLTEVMPNWKEVKLRLDGMAELYLE